jgi:predicted permease
MIAQLFAIIAPILVCSAIGYGWARIKAPFHSETLGSLVFLVGTPCLVFSTLTSIRLDHRRARRHPPLPDPGLSAIAVAGGNECRTAGRF